MKLNRYLKKWNLHTSLLIQNEDDKDELTQIFDTSSKRESNAKQNEDLMVLLSGIDANQQEK